MMKVRARFAPLVIVGVLGLSGVVAASSAWAAGNLHVVASSPAAKGNLQNVTWDLGRGEPKDLDPAQSNDFSVNEVVANLCEQLYTTTVAANGKLEELPDLATATSHPNPLTYIYTIRQGVHFWDGRRLTAADVAFSLHRNLVPSVHSSWTAYYANVKSIHAAGPYKVTVRLKRPDVLFNEAMGTAAGAVVERTYTLRHHDVVGTPAVPVMCSGPFVLEKWTPGTSIVMVRNSHYWNTTAIPKVHTFTFDFIDDPAAITNALLDHEVQGIYNFPVQDVPQLEASSAGTVYAGTSSLMINLEPNAQPNGKIVGPMADARIRQALSLVINRQQIARRLYYGAASPAKGFLPPSTWSYAQAVFSKAYNALPPVAVNISKAKKLVAEVPDASQPITLVYNGGSAGSSQVTALVQQDAAAIGLHITLQPETEGPWVDGLFDTAKRAGWDLMFVTNNLNAPDPLDLFATTFTDPYFLDWSNYRNPTVARALSAARGQSNPTKRANLVVAAEKIAIDQHIWIPLLNQTDTLFMAKGVTGASPAFVWMTSPWAASVGATR